MGQLYITREHLDLANRIGMASKDEIIDNTIVAATSIAASTAFGVVVGYRHAAGKSDEEAMPGVGPVPADAIVGLGGLVSGIFMRGRLGKVALGLGIAGSNVFGMSAGQSLGGMLFDKMKTGAGQEAPQMSGAPKNKEIPAGTPGYRDAYGNFHPGQKKSGTGGVMEAEPVNATRSAKPAHETGKPAQDSPMAERWERVG